MALGEVDIYFQLLNYVAVFIQDDSDLNEVVPVLTPKQARTLRRRIETFKATTRQKNKAHRRDVRGLFSGDGAAVVDVTDTDYHSPDVSVKCCLNC